MPKISSLCSEMLPGNSSVLKPIDQANENEWTFPLTIVTSHWRGIISANFSSTRVSSVLNASTIICNGTSTVWKFSPSSIVTEIPNSLFSKAITVPFAYGWWCITWLQNSK